MDKVRHLGWKLMGYPYNRRGWKFIYRFGAWMHNL